jgi:hypothetical protein
VEVTGMDPRVFSLADFLLGLLARLVGPHPTGLDGIPHQEDGVLMSMYRTSPQGTRSQDCLHGVRQNTT